FEDRRLIAGGRCKDADPRQLIRWLTACRHRPRQCGCANYRPELPPLHSIISSARPSMDAGMLSPNASAARRFTISSNVDGRSIGILAGLEPARTFPAKNPA